MSAGTAYNLSYSLVKEINDITRDFRLQSNLKDGKAIPPIVINGYMPTKRKRDEPEAPVILIKFDGGNDDLNSNEAVITCDIIIVTTSEDDESGFFDAVNVCERIRGHLLSKRIIDNKYQIRGFSWKVPPEQAYPYWMVVAKATYYVHLPQDSQFIDRI